MAGGDEALLDATVARDGGQYTTPSGLVRVEDELAVGREARAFVDRARSSAPASGASRNPAIAIWKRPPSRRTNTKPLPSGNGRAETL